MQRKVVVGVMGGNASVGAVATEAKLVGANLSRLGCILLTGGKCIENMDVKNATLTGAAEAESTHGTVARLVGILPDSPRLWDDTHPRRLFLSTNLRSAERDVITGATPDSLIFFPGSCGTLCELAFAVAAGRPVLFWKATQTLREKFQIHTRDKELDGFLDVALRACRMKLGAVAGVTINTSVSSMRAILGDSLQGASDFSSCIGDLAAEALQHAGIPSRYSGFPGFSDERNSKEKFEVILERISR